MDLKNISIQDANCMLKKGECSVSELLTSSYDRIEKIDEEVKAFITLSKDVSEEQSLVAQKKFEEKTDTLLTGIPYSVKDNISTKGVKTTCASKMLENYIPIYDATVIEKLNTHMPIMVGKVNMDEFAMGGSTEKSAFFPTKNPFDTDYVPGGSSGGSAVSVASGEVLFSLGSDTGGSVRQPASYCGIVGVKPTYGRISRYGLVAFGSSLDQVGILTKNVADSAIVLNAISGKDRMDSTSADIRVDEYLNQLDGNIKGLRIGIIKELFEDGIDSDVKDAIKNAIEKFEELGAICEIVDLKHIRHSIETYYIIAPSEASSNLSRFDGVKYGYRTKNYSDLEEMYINTRSEGFGDEVKRRILLGTFTLSAGYYDAYYQKALKVRTLIKQDFVNAFKKYDLLLSPTAPNVAFRCGEKTNDPLSMYLEDLCTIPVNLAGLPAISIPCGRKGKLPIGLQLIGNYFKEGTMLKAADAFEKSTDYHKMVTELD